MTFQPPPPPPGGQPEQPYGGPPPAGPPPGGQWGPPSAAGYSQQPGYPQPAPGHSPPAAGFDPKSVNPLDWAIMGAGLLTFVFSFVSYYSYTVKAAGFGSATLHWSAWHGFFGWFAMVLAVIGSVAVALAVFVPLLKLPFRHAEVTLATYALATLCLILALFIVPGNTSGASAAGIHVDKGHAIGFWISLVVVIIGLVLSLVRFQQSGGGLPGPLGSTVSNLGGHLPGTPTAGPTPPMAAPGYGQPPAPPAYGQQPPPGYQPPPGGPAQQPPPGYQPPPPPPSGYQPPQ